MTHPRHPALAALVLAVAASSAALGTAAQSPAPSPAASLAGPEASLAPAGTPAPSVPVGQTVTVTAVDHQFKGLPSSVPVGTRLALTNNGREVHELLVARRNDGVTESWDELLALPQDQLADKVTLLGPLVAEPSGMGRGAEGGGFVLVLPQEGDYLALCFVPPGTTVLPGTSASPDPAASFGPPHAALGMRQAFQVTAPGSTPGPMPTAAPMP